MKKLLFLVLVFASVVAFAQSNEGTVIYEIKVNMHRRLPADQKDMRAMIPEFRTSKMQLFFNQNESFYKNVEEENDEEEASNGGVQIKFTTPQNELYFDFANKKKVEMREFMTKKFLIEGELKANAWKLSDETKTIKGYVCKKATYINEERKQNIVVWYAEQIPVSAGPDSFHSLMGLVLQVDINDGEIVTTAATIDFKALKKGDIKIPTEGKKITPEEFKKMVDEKMKEMGGNGGIRIIRN
ncbi:MAG: GLPGLI family protein [Cytophagales bacterium]|nr:MAG: GLPGLI family protein [Cytophagales bacterium]